MVEFIGEVVTVCEGGVRESEGFFASDVFYGVGLSAWGKYG